MALSDAAEMLVSTFVSTFDKWSVHLIILTSWVPEPEPLNLNLNLNLNLIDSPFLSCIQPALALRRALDLSSPGHLVKETNAASLSVVCCFDTASVEEIVAFLVEPPLSGEGA